MIAVFAPSGGSNSIPHLVALCADQDAYERWVAHDDYTIERRERKTPGSVHGNFLIFVFWHGLQVGFGFNQPEAMRAIERHKAGRATLYILREMEVFT